MGSHTTLESCCDCDLHKDGLDERIVGAKEVPGHKRPYLTVSNYCTKTIEPFMNASKSYLRCDREIDFASSWHSFC
jgi:hypothetical protein